MNSIIVVSSEFYKESLILPNFSEQPIYAIPQNAYRNLPNIYDKVLAKTVNG